MLAPTPALCASSAGFATAADGTVSDSNVRMLVRMYPLLLAQVDGWQDILSAPGTHWRLIFTAGTPPASAWCRSIAAAAAAAAPDLV